MKAQAAADATQPSAWADLRAALRGSQADYTRIPVKRAVFLLAIPMMLELVLESTFAVTSSTAGGWSQRRPSTARATR